MARILVIDDEAPIRHVLRQALELRGHTVVEAQNGAIGLRLFQTEPADLVITDILMPEVEGLECIMKLRKISPDLRIIAMSGGGLTVHIDVLSLAHPLGACRIFAKPFDLHRMVAAIEEELRDHRAA